MQQKESTTLMVRACPNGSLKKPVRKFEETFSAEKIVLEKFFKSDT